MDQSKSLDHGHYSAFKLYFGRPLLGWFGLCCWDLFVHGNYECQHVGGFWCGVEKLADPSAVVSADQLCFVGFTAFIIGADA